MAETTALRAFLWDGTAQHSRRSHSAVMAEEQRQEGLCMVSLWGFIDHTQEGTRDKEPRAEEGAGLYTEQWEN